MKELNQYIQEKLIVNNTIQDNTTDKQSVEEIYNILKTNYPVVISMVDIAEMCIYFNKNNQLGLEAICADNYISDEKDPLNLNISSNTDLSNVIKKYGNIFIIDPKTKTVKYFLWYTNNLEYVKHYIKNFIDNGFIIYVSQNKYTYKYTYKIYTKQEILDMV